MTLFELIRAVGLDLQYCDFCGRSEVDEIINTRGNAPLIQMTSDDDLTICVACLEADTSEPGAEGSE